MKREKWKTICILVLTAAVIVLGVMLARTAAHARSERENRLQACRATIETINDTLFGMQAADPDAQAQLITRAQGSAEVAARLLNGIASPTAEEALLQEYFDVIRSRAPIILKADSQRYQEWFAQTAHYLSTGDLDSLKSVIDGINALAA